MTQAEKALETWKAAVEARMNAMQREIDTLTAANAAHVENINLLRGDRQRVQQEQQGTPQGFVDLKELPKPIRNGRRPTPEQLKREQDEAHPAPSFREARGR